MEKFSLRLKRCEARMIESIYPKATATRNLITKHVAFRHARRCGYSKIIEWGELALRFKLPRNESYYTKNPYLTFKCQEYKDAFCADKIHFENPYEYIFFVRQVILDYLDSEKKAEIKDCKHLFYLMNLSRDMACTGNLFRFFPYQKFFQKKMRKMMKK